MRERSQPGHPARRPLRKAAEAITIAIVLLGAGPITSAGAVCLNEDQSPSELTIQSARGARLCLINEERVARGLHALAVNVHLQRTAQKHSKAMNVRNFFGHRNLGKRIERSGYLKGASSWSLGETLDWGRAEAGSPQAAVTAWIASPPHRRLMLSGAFEDVGVGVAMGAPIRGQGQGAAIYTADFGFRRR
jgi:uncharacterized protein YkwD